MKPATHTPGPWVAVKSEAHAGNPDSVRVDIHALGAAYSPAHVASDIMPEDARLIAAAPDMLEALEVFVAAGADLQAGKRDGATMGRVSLATGAARALLARIRTEATP